MNSKKGNEVKIEIAFCLAFWLMLLMGGCGDPRSGDKAVIVGKSFSTYMNDPMPKGICRFWYKGSGIDFHEFQDSCHFYQVLDTIPKKK